MLKLPCTPKESSEKPAVTAGTRERDIHQSLQLDPKAEKCERGVRKRQVVGAASCLYRTYKGCEVRVQVGERVLLLSIDPIIKCSQYGNYGFSERRK